MLIHGFEVAGEPGSVGADLSEVFLRPEKRLLRDIYREQHFIRWFVREFGERAAVRYPDVLPGMVFELYEPVFAEHEALFDSVAWHTVLEWDLVACGCLKEGRVS